MHLQINPHDQAPVYRQIQRQITRAIAERHIHPGDRLDSHKDLAIQLAVSPAAVRKAYRGLRDEGLCRESLTGELRVSHPDLRVGDRGRTGLALTLLKRELLDEELRAARAVQARLLPPPTIQRPSFSVHSRSYPCSSLAGDFYDVVEHSSGDVDLIVADVAGKGLGAGLIMAATKSLISQIASHPTPGDALNELNERLSSLLGAREFVALAYARFDPARGRLEIANAGLPDPYLLRRNGKVETLEVSGNRLPLGLRQGARYATEAFDLEPEDRLLMVTDGIPEAIDLDGNAFGYERLRGLLGSKERLTDDEASDGSEAWLDRFLERVGQHTGSILDDDWTALLLDYDRPEESNSCRS